MTVLVGGAALEGARGETVSFVLDLTERKRAEAVRRGEKELGAAIETIPAMVWSAWPDGHADFFNRRWQEYTGLSLEQSLGWEWGATVHPEDAEQYFGRWHECIAAGQPIEVEVRFRRAADGEYRWFTDSGVPLRDEQGNVLKWYGVVTDIDDRKRAEAFLAGEERATRWWRGATRSPGSSTKSLCLLVEAQAPGVLASVLLVDGNRLRHGGAPSLPKAYTDAIDGGLIGPQAGSCGTAAYRAEQVIVSDIATDPLWADYRDAALPHGLRACWSTPIFSSAGKVIATFAMYYRNARSPDTRDQQIIEQIGHLAGVAIQSKAAQEELKKRAALLKNLAHDAIIVRDIESRIVFWNSGADKTYGWTAQEAIGRVSHELLHTRFPVSREDVDFALQEKGEWEGELTHVTRHGTEIVVTSRQSLRRDEHGAGATILEINRDLTERKKAEEAARQIELRGVVETVPGMVWSALPDGRVDFINRRWQEFTGLTLDETLGWKAEAPFHPDDVEHYMAKWNASLATGQSFEAEMRIRRGRR